MTTSAPYLVAVVVIPPRPQRTRLDFTQQHHFIDAVVLNALRHPVLMIGPDGKIADANVAAEAFFEKPEDAAADQGSGEDEKAD